MMHEFTVDDLKAQRAELDERIAELEWLERQEIIERVRSLIAEYSLNPGEVFPKFDDFSYLSSELPDDLPKKSHAQITKHKKKMGRNRSVD